MRRLADLVFDNTYARLPAAFHQHVLPTALPDPYLVSFNPDAAALLDLDPAEAERPEVVQYFGGVRSLPGSEPIAALYAGHQFGHYAPQLGDGRAILLGEVWNAAGEKWDVQLKGAGTTAYSRGFDGRSVLRSAIREYLCGEAMHGLGIPTTRALCIVGSDEPVRREGVETAAALVRLAPTHVRFGSFEVFAYRGQEDHLATLADYAIHHHYPDLAGADRYSRFLREVVERTARLIAAWQAVGFAHGVMNTDNMSIIGLTLDYGPFSFLNAYRPGFIPNHSDPDGRYAFNEQPSVGLWNCTALAQALLPIVPREEAVAALDAYVPAFETEFGRLMRAKLGLVERRDEDVALVGELLAVLEAARVDYTVFFRRLADLDVAPDARPALRAMFADPAAWHLWLELYRDRLDSEGGTGEDRQRRMRRANPKYILRNHLLQEAITRTVASRDYSEVDRLLGLLHHPYSEQPELERYAAPPPEWAREVAVSCSS